MTTDETELGELNPHPADDYPIENITNVYNPDPDRRLHWMWFICGLAGMALAAIVLVVITNRVADAARERQVTKRERITACQNIETEAGRLLCIDGMK